MEPYKDDKTDSDKIKSDKIKDTFSWRDIFAFCIALYKLLLPQLLLTFLLVVLGLFLVFSVWL